VLSSGVVVIPESSGTPSAASVSAAAALNSSKTRRLGFLIFEERTNERLLFLSCFPESTLFVSLALIRS